MCTLGEDIYLEKVKKTKRRTVFTQPLLSEPFDGFNVCPAIFILSRKSINKQRLCTIDSEERIVPLFSL